MFRWTSHMLEWSVNLPVSQDESLKEVVIHWPCGRDREASAYFHSEFCWSLIGDKIQLLVRKFCREDELTPLEELAERIGHNLKSSLLTCRWQLSSSTNPCQMPVLVSICWISGLLQQWNSVPPEVHLENLQINPWSTVQSISSLWELHCCFYGNYYKQNMIFPDLHYCSRMLQWHRWPIPTPFVFSKSPLHSGRWLHHRFFSLWNLQIRPLSFCRPTAKLANILTNVEIHRLLSFTQIEWLHKIRCQGNSIRSKVDFLPKPLPGWSDFPHIKPKRTSSCQPTWGICSGKKKLLS